MLKRTTGLKRRHQVVLLPACTRSVLGAVAGLGCSAPSVFLSGSVVPRPPRPRWQLVLSARYTQTNGGCFIVRLSVASLAIEFTGAQLLAFRIQIPSPVGIRSPSEHLDFHTGLHVDFVYDRADRSQPAIDQPLTIW